MCFLRNRFRQRSFTYRPVDEYCIVVWVVKDDGPIVSYRTYDGSVIVVSATMNTIAMLLTMLHGPHGWTS